MMICRSNGLSFRMTCWTSRNALFPINVPRLLDALQGSFDFLETDQFRVHAPFADDVRSCRVVGYAEGPGLE